MNHSPIARRYMIRNTALGLFGLTHFDHVSASRLISHSIPFLHDESLYYRYPAIHDNHSYGVVLAAHSDINKVKELVSIRPELAGAAWDWGYGDYETALGAASHTGRRDIAEYLMSEGARPDIFTFAMMGMLSSLQEIIETIPGIQSHRGPHGITLLKHALNRLANKDITTEDKNRVSKVVSYLEGLGNANIGATSLPLTKEDKKILAGDYRFGAGDTEVFSIGPLSMDPEHFLRITRKGLPGRLMHKIGDYTFSPTGASSVKIVFEVIDDVARSLTIHEPDPLVIATRV